MNRLGSQTIYSLVSSVAIPNECLVLSKVALHQIPRKWQAACRIISNGFLSWCLKDVIFGCFSLHAVTEKVPSRGSQERQRRKRTLSCFAYSLSDLTALFKITHYYYFTAENAFSTCLTVEKNLIRCVYFPPECLTSVIVFCMTFWDPIGCLPLQEWGLSMWVLSKKCRKLRTGYPGSTSLRN